MDKVTIITRAETTSVERNWRQSGGGRVFTFDMMLELPQSHKIAGLGRDSEVVFEDKRYFVNHKEVVREAPPELVRLVLNGAGSVTETQGVRGRRHGSPASFTRVGNMSPLRSQREVTSAFFIPVHNSDARPASSPQ
jgi:hypothetical protein